MHTCIHTQMHRHICIRWMYKNIITMIKRVLPEDIFNACSLSEECIDNGCSCGDQGCLQQVAQDGQHWVEPIKPALLWASPEEMLDMLLIYWHWADVVSCRGNVSKGVLTLVEIVLCLTGLTGLDCCSIASCCCVYCECVPFGAHYRHTVA